MEVLFEDLNEVPITVKQIVSRGHLWQRLKSSADDKKAIAKFNERILASCDLFEIRSVINIHQAVTRMETRLDARSDLERSHRGMSTPGLDQLSAVVRNERRRRYENILVELKQTKDVASTTCLVLPIIQSIESAENPLATFSQNAGRLVSAVTQQMRIGEILGDIKPIVEDLFEELRHGQLIIKQVASQGALLRYISQANEEQAISACNERILRACHLFEIRSAINIYQALTRMEAQLSLCPPSEQPPAASSREGPSSSLPVGHTAA